MSNSINLGYLQDRPTIKPNLETLAISKKGRFLIVNSNGSLGETGWLGYITEKLGFNGVDHCSRALVRPACLKFLQEGVSNKEFSSKILKHQALIRSLALRAGLIYSIDNGKTYQIDLKEEAYNYDLSDRLEKAADLWQPIDSLVADRLRLRAIEALDRWKHGRSSQLSNAEKISDPDIQIEAYTKIVHHLDFAQSRIEIARRIQSRQPKAADFLLLDAVEILQRSSNDEVMKIKEEAIALIQDPATKIKAYISIAKALPCVKDLEIADRMEQIDPRAADEFRISSIERLRPWNEKDYVKLKLALAAAIRDPKLKLKAYDLFCFKNCGGLSQAEMIEIANLIEKIDSFAADELRVRIIASLTPWDDEQIMSLKRRAASAIKNKDFQKAAEKEIAKTWPSNKITQ